MDRKHSWTWLPTRFTHLQATRNASSPKSRPCLPILEQLEDRVLLSVSTGGTDSILIGLLRGELDLRASQVSLLKQAETVSDGSQTANDALTSILGNLTTIDAAVYKLTTDALTEVGNKADAAGQKYLEIKLQDVIISSFEAIDKQISGLSPAANDELLPAVRTLEDATTGFLSTLTNLPAIQRSDLNGFLKLQDDLLKVDVILDTAAKVSLSDIHVTKPIDVASPKLLTALDDSFLKLRADLADAFGDKTAEGIIKTEIAPLGTQTEGILVGLLQPAPVGTPVTDALAITPTTDIIG